MEINRRFRKADGGGCGKPLQFSIKR